MIKSMATDTTLKVFFKDYFFCLTTEEKIIGGKRCNDMDPNSTQNEGTIIRNLAKDKGISVEGYNYDDMVAFVKNVIKENGGKDYYVYGDFILRVVDDEFRIYGCSNKNRCIDDAIIDAGFVPQDNWDCNQKQENFIRYLLRLQDYQDYRLACTLIKKWYDLPGSLSLLHMSAEERDLRARQVLGVAKVDKVLDVNKITEAYRSNFGKRTMLLFGCKEKEDENKTFKANRLIAEAISEIIYPKDDSTSIKFRAFDLTKVTDAKQFWTDLYVLTDYKKYTYIFTGVDQVQDHDLQEIIIYMMKREEYRPKDISSKEMVDFSQTNPILINMVDNLEDSIPAYAHNRMLQAYIENIWTTKNE